MALSSLSVLIVLVVVCQSKQKPNVLLLLADDLGYGDMQLFGHPTSSTPNLNKLVDTSKVLTNFYVASPVCSPSRAALLTGLYPISTGIYPGVLWPNSLGGLNSSSHVTLATRLLEIGYKTAHIGKWHLGVGPNREYMPTRHGFQHYLGIPYSHDMCPCKSCFPDGEKCLSNECHSEYVSCPLFLDETIVEQPTDLTKVTDLYTNAAIQFIKASSSETPFFLYYAFHQTHHPQFAARGFRNSTERGSFGDALAEMDASIGTLMNSLEKLALLNNTIIIFTSDNGPSLCRHERGGSAGLLRCGKGTTWEGGMRVPALVKWDGYIKPGRSNKLMASMDIVPTIMSLVGSPVSPTELLHGRDCSKMLVLDSKSARDSLLYYSDRPAKEVGIMAVRNEKFKAHFFTSGNSLSDDTNYDTVCRSESKLEKQDPPLLYDINADPGERYPLSNNTTEDYAATIKALEKIRQDMTSKIVWAPSEMDKGNGPRTAPCCHAVTCEPYPTCCDC